MVWAYALFSAFGQDCVDYAVDPKQLVNLEDYATKGALEAGQKECLEKAYDEAELQTTKDKVSRVLLVNAYAYNTKDWAKLVKRHLDEVDRSDPDIAYLYAFYLYNNDKADSDEVIDWTETALERRDVWTGDVYVSRVYGLMRLRSMAGLSLWQLAEEKRIAGDKSKSPEQLDQLRNRAKTFAREWVDFAKASGRSSEQPMELCLSVANEKACGA